MRCRGRLIDLHAPKVMGILNVTPDSFHDGGQYLDIAQAVDRAFAMHEAGAAIIDIGAASSRPGAVEVEEEEEADRLLPVVEALVAENADLIVSIDTYRASIAERALEVGASIINDISGGLADKRMVEVVAKSAAPYICMHRQGTSDTMQDAPAYGNVVTEVGRYFSERLATLRENGIEDVIIDPGFGFGKSVEHNYQLLHHLQHFAFLGSPVLVGVSRKSMINKVLGIRPSDALNGTTALHMACLQRGASILRVHDVKEAVECIGLHQMIEENEME